MKNVFKKAIKLFDKQEVVIISRNGDEYGIICGYFGLRMPAATYDLYFRPEKPYYVQLEDRQTWKSYKNTRKSSVGELSPDYMDVDKLFPVDATAAKITPFLYEIDGRTARVFAGDDLIIANDAFVEAFVDVFGTEYIYSAGRIKPLLWQDGMQPVASGVLLPVNAQLPEPVRDAILAEYR